MRLLLDLLLIPDRKFLKLLLLLHSLLLSAEVLNLVFSLLESVVVLLMIATATAAMVNGTHLVLVSRLLLAKLDILL